MKIIIPMAGMGKRFKDAGYTVEKYEIIWKAKTLFEHSVNSLSDFFDHEFIFIGREDTGFKQNIEKLIKKTGLKKYSIVSLSNITTGQAETVFEYTKNMCDESILIFNIDTYIKPGLIKQTNIKTNYWWLVANLQGEKWSFINIGSDGKFETSEKKRISNHASLGLYYFSSSNEFNSIFVGKGSEIKREWKETYIAPMYNYVDKTKTMSIFEIKQSDFKILGTPEDLKNACD